MAPPTRSRCLYIPTKIYDRHALSFKTVKYHFMINKTAHTRIYERWVARWGRQDSRGAFFAWKIESFLIVPAIVSCEVY